MEQIEQLRLLKGRLIGNISHNKRYYHLKSVKNFILHFKEIRDANDRQKIFDLLREYLEGCLENGISSVSECEELFTGFISPIGQIYEDQIGFVLFVKPWLVIWWVLILATGISLLHLPFWSYVLLLILAFWYYWKILKAVYVKKTYGYMY